MSRFQKVFGAKKPVIAMVHLGAMPGTPLYDADAGVEGIIRGAKADLAALQSAGFDAVMFGNENDRPYFDHHGLCDWPGTRPDQPAVRGECAVGPDGDDGAGGRDRRAFCARDFHRNLCQ